MTPTEITLLFKEAQDAFLPLEGKPTDDDLLSIRETLLPILMEIPYDQVGGVHSLTAIITDAVRYAANHGGNAFTRPSRLPLYDTNIHRVPHKRQQCFSHKRQQCFIPAKVCKQLTVQGRHTQSPTCMECPKQLENRRPRHLHR